MSPKKDKDDSYKKYVIKKTIDFLKNKKGFHTELITLMIPPDRKIFDVTNYLKNEISESVNIKSKLTRKNVLDSINSLLQKLKNIKSPPENGLILFSGAIPQGNSPGTEKNETYIIEPIEPITTFKYHCASEFLLDPLVDQLTDKQTYGIIVIDNKEYSIGSVRGSKITYHKNQSSGIASSHHAGGQSQRRFERLHDEGVKNFTKKCAESANEIFLPMLEEKILEGIFIGGSAFTKQSLAKIDDLDYRLKQKLIEPLVDIGAGGNEGIRAVLVKIQDQISDLGYIKEKKLMQEFLFNISRDTGLSTYGEEEVRKALMAAAVKTLLLSEGLTKRRLSLKCESCDNILEISVKSQEEEDIEMINENNKCSNCGANHFNIEENQDIIENLGSLAENVGTKVEILSTSTEEGEGLMSTFGGVAAILRYRLNM
jgi:peptide chain release factor subunit 1